MNIEDPLSLFFSFSQSEADDLVPSCLMIGIYSVLEKKKGVEFVATYHITAYQNTAIDVDMLIIISSLDDFLEQQWAMTHIYKVKNMLPYEILRAVSLGTRQNHGCNVV